MELRAARLLISSLVGIAMRQPLFQIMDVGAAFHELGIDHQILVQWDIGVDAFHHRLQQGGTHAGHGLLTGVAVRDDLADHGVVVGGHKVVVVHMGIHAHAWTTWRMPHGDAAWRGDELVRIFRVHTALDGVTLELNLAHGKHTSGFEELTWSVIIEPRINSF